MDILSTLNLDDVKAPGELPVGTYDGVITQSEFVIQDARGDKPSQISHVLTYKVQSQDDSDGEKKAHWFNLGVNPVDADGNLPKSIDDVVAYEPTMSEKSKKYYKEAWVNLGFPEGKGPVAALVGLPITFRLYKSGAFVNVALNGLRQGVDATNPYANAPAADSSPFENGAPQF